MISRLGKACRIVYITVCIGYTLGFWAFEWLTWEWVVIALSESIILYYKINHILDVTERWEGVSTSIGFPDKCPVLMKICDASIGYLPIYHNHRFAYFFTDAQCLPRTHILVVIQRNEHRNWLCTRIGCATRTLTLEKLMRLNSIPKQRLGAMWWN